MYAPVVLAYEQGTYIGLKEFEAPAATQQACEDILRREIEVIGHTAPPGAKLIGQCLAIPVGKLLTDRTASAPDVDPPNTTTL